MTDILIISCETNVAPISNKLCEQRRTLMVITITTHLLSIESADWLKLSDIFKATTPGNVNFRLESVPCICYSSTFIHDVVACRESRCVIKAKHVFLSVNSFTLPWENCIHAEVHVQLSQRNSNWSTGQQNMFYNIAVDISWSNITR